MINIRKTDDGRTTGGRQADDRRIVCVTFAPSPLRTRGVKMLLDVVEKTHRRRGLTSETQVHAQHERSFISKQLLHWRGKIASKPSLHLPTRVQGDRPELMPVTVIKSVWQLGLNCADRSLLLEYNVL